MPQYLLCFFALLLSSHGIAQTDATHQTTNILIEDFTARTTYQSKEMTLQRIENRSPTKQDVKQFEKLIACGIPIELLTTDSHTLPEEITAYGKIFRKVGETEGTVQYETGVEDSAQHYLEFVYDPFVLAQPLQKASVRTLNVRSGVISPRFEYKLWLSR